MWSNLDCLSVSDGEITENYLKCYIFLIIFLDVIIILVNFVGEKWRIHCPHQWWSQVINKNKIGGSLRMEKEI